jgi:hypothetical protein
VAAGWQPPVAAFAEWFVAPDFLGCTFINAVAKLRAGAAACPAAFFVDGPAQILCHLAFRDYLRAHPDEMSAYDAAPGPVPV